MDTKKKALIGVSAITVLVILGFIGSRLFSKKVENPYEIMVNGKILSMYDSSIEDFEANGFEVCEGILSSMSSENNNIEIYNDEIWAITIHDDSVTTYKSISVGDDISKVVDVFEYESVYENVYSVYFNKVGKEIKPTKATKEGCSVFYNFEDSKIKYIGISDNKIGIK